MSVTGFEIDIEAPVERVWAVLGERSPQPNWLPRGLADSDKDEPQRVHRTGECFQHRVRFLGRVWAMECDTVAHEPPWLVEYFLDHGAAEVTLTYELIRSGTGTRLTLVATLGAKKLGARAVLLLVHPLILRVLAKHIDRLKRLAEDTVHGVCWTPQPSASAAMQGELFAVGEKAA